MKFGVVGLYVARFQRMCKAAFVHRGTEHRYHCLRVSESFWTWWREIPLPL